MKQRLCGEIEGKHWARVKGALHGSSHVYPWLRGPKSLSSLWVLVSHLYSKEFKQEHSNISTKAALTAKEGKNVEIWEHSVNQKLVFFL